MKRAGVGVLAAIIGLSVAAPSSAQSTNNWSFVDSFSGQTVRGTLSGIVNGSNLSAAGLTATVTYSPHAVHIGSYNGPTYGTYSASNGLISFADFAILNNGSTYVSFATSDSQNYLPEIYNTDTGENWTISFSGPTTFSQTAAAPEFSTWISMIIGFFVVGIFLRRNRQMRSALV